MIDWRQDLLHKHNAERSKYKRGLLVLDGSLNLMAQSHSDAMAKYKFLDHDRVGDGSFQDRLLSFRIRYTNAAENIAQTYNDQTSLVFDLWMGSFGHRRNILMFALTEVGFGRAISKDNQYYWTTVFILKDGFNRASNHSLSGPIVIVPKSVLKEN